MRRVFITGGTGYMGRRLIEELLARGDSVTALARPGSEQRLPPGCAVVSGNALDAATYSARVAPAVTFVHLVGVPRPNPWKEKQFREVDLPGTREALRAARAAGIRQFIYVSVAQPAPLMRAYVQVRSECEQMLIESGLNITILRPWYVLGPGHWWPAVLLPLYWAFESLPPTRDAARRLGLLRLNEMLLALRGAIRHPADGIRILDVPLIRAAARKARELNGTH